MTRFELETELYRLYSGLQDFEDYDCEFRYGYDLRQVELENKFDLLCLRLNLDEQVKKSILDILISNRIGG